MSRGKTWRIHYWLLKKDRIRDVGRDRVAATEDTTSALYRDIGDSAWNRRGGQPPTPPAP